MTEDISFKSREWFEEAVSSMLKAIAIGEGTPYYQTLSRTLKRATNQQLPNLLLMLRDIEGEILAQGAEKSPFLTEILYKGQLIADQELAMRMKELNVLKKRGAKENKLLTDITNSIISSLDMREIFRVVATKMSNLIQFDRASIVLINESKHTTSAFVLVTRARSSYREGEYPLTGTAQEWMLQNRMSCIEADLSNHKFREDKPLFREGLRSSIRVPLFLREKVIGSINLDSKQFGMYTDSEKRLLEQVAGQIAVAVENSRLFEEVRQRAEQIASINNSLESMVHQKTAKIVELEKKRAAMTGLIAHSLKNPIIGLRQAIKLITRNEIFLNPNFLRRFLDELYSSCDMLLGIVNDMLDVYRYEFDMVPLNLEYMSITEPLNDALHLLRYEISDKNVHVELQCAARELTVNGDRRRLCRVFLNLLDNAVKFSPAGGRIDVSVTSDSAQSIVVTIDDEGPGIPEFDLTRIFEQFYQVERKNMPIKDGSGLGLYYCKMLAEAHGGKLWAENRNPNGTSMRLGLPTTKED